MPEPPPKKLHLHNDVIWDRPYEDHELDLRTYKPFTSPLVSQNRDTNGVTCVTANGERIRIEPCATNVMRIRYFTSANSDALSLTEKLDLLSTDFPQTDFVFASTGDAFQITTEALKLGWKDAGREIDISTRSGSHVLSSINRGIRFSTQATYSGGSRFFGEFAIDSENFFGFGGRIAPPNRTGATADIFSVKAGVHWGDYGGFPIPFFMSTKGYGFFLNNPWPHVYFDMGKSDPHTWFMHAPGGECDMFIIYGPEFSDILETFTRMTGRIPAPQKWWFGFWCSSIAFTGADEVLNVAQRMRRDGYPCDAVALDGGWRGGPDFLRQYREGKKYPSNDLNWHPDFGDGPDMMRKLKEIGTKTVLHLNSRNYSPETQARGLKEGFLRQHGQEVVVKLTSQSAEKIYSNMVTPRVKEGVDLWWTDHSDRVGGEITGGVPSRNLFGALWNRLLNRIGSESGAAASLCLSRGGGIGSQRFALPWPGDTEFGIDRFAEDIWFCLNAGLAGFPVTSVDIGGFTVKAERYENDEQSYAQSFDLENVARRMCQSIMFIPTPRIHHNWCSLPKFPWNCPPATQQLYKNALTFRYALTPYIYTYALRASRTGEPILRPLVYHHRCDRRTWSIGDEFYLGESLLFAPVTEPGRTSRTVYLPAGSWIHYWTGRRFDGEQRIEIDAPLLSIEGLPIFVKANSVIPRQQPVQFLDERLPDELILELFPLSSGSFCLHESPAHSTHILFNRDKSTLNVVIDDASGLKRTFHLQAAMLSDFDTIKVNGEAVDAHPSGDARTMYASVSF
ncbi:MAG: hypothetical protein GF398_02035 [Chitinivibrionales bacterium]|nr:hypothetical protein [Chitinivibrionales bacterium]